MSKSDYHRFVPEMGTALHFGMSQKEFLQSLSKERWERRRLAMAKLLAVPFKGTTADGTVTPDLFELREEGAPTEAILQAVAVLLCHLTPEQRQAVLLPINSTERQTWQNSIAHYENFALRLDQVTLPVRDAVLGVVSASLSASGYERSRKIMKLNGFLGELVGAPLLLGEYCYQFHFFGEPSATEPWGWQLSGHHLCLTCFIVGTQMTLTPTFMGAEPVYADAGQYDGVSAFEDEEQLGLAFARSLSAEQRRIAVIHDTIAPEELPPGRHHAQDGLTLGGAYQDNRVIPYEGITGAQLTVEQRQALLHLAECYLSTLPAGPLTARMSDVDQHIAETYFCWAGGLEDDSVFYYRIQSPVVMIEFDHHQGVVLSNGAPEKFHIHTIVRTPNGNDYGTDLLRLHYETAAHHKHRHGHDHDHDKD